MSVLTYEGSSALSDFQRERLVARLGNGVATISARYLHYVHLHDGATLSAEENKRLQRILSYGEDFTQPVLKEGLHRHTLHVYPRPATISPWSSQATEISHTSDLRKVKRIERGIVLSIDSSGRDLSPTILRSRDLYDRMTQCLTADPPSLEVMFAEHDPQPLRIIQTQGPNLDAKQVILKANKDLGLALEEQDIDLLAAAFGEGGTIGRNPTDVELYTFAQINSEHCRHRFFNSKLVIDGQLKGESLFSLIKSTHKKAPGGVTSAFTDNAAVLEGFEGTHWAPSQNGEWQHIKEDVRFTLKAETHNHPCQVSPFPGAATGVGGELRDEGSIGTTGSTPQAGLAGFITSDLLIPGHRKPWEIDIGFPSHTTSSFGIMMEAPIGAAQYANEFGRPCVNGFFRTLTTTITSEGNVEQARGYHKPVMLAGGVGRCRPQTEIKAPGSVAAGSYAVVLGGPAMLIGLGGGAASSRTSSDQDTELDFQSVQRGSPEMQRRAHELIQACVAMGVDSPIKFIHDVGAGGLSNALPELAHDCALGASLELRDIDSADRSMSPMELWCCEAQERYVLAIDPTRLNEFKKMADRERASYAVVGKITAGEPKRLILMDRDSTGPPPLDLPMDFIFAKPSLAEKALVSRKLQLSDFDASLRAYLPSASVNDILQEAVDRVLSIPCVSSKAWLVHIADRSVGGLTARDQPVGPWQTILADCSVSATSLTVGNYHGNATAMGERPPLALISPAASARMALGEALLNLAAGDIIDQLNRVRLSGNWMAARHADGEGAALYEAVQAICDLCPQLGVSIVTGKDSLSMQTSWKEGAKEKKVISPVTLAVTALSPVLDIRSTWTPTLRRLEDVGESLICFVDLAEGKKALGGSCLSQCFKQVGGSCPDVRSVQLFKDFFDAVDQLHKTDVILAYHDISDGGLLTTLVEMMFAGRCGLEINLDDVSKSSGIHDVNEALFAEELGAVFQVKKSMLTEFRRCFASCGPPAGLIKIIGRVPKKSKQELVISRGTDTLYRASRTYLQQKWASDSYHMQRQRDNPKCADSEYQGIAENEDPGLTYNLTFDPKEQPRTNTLSLSGLMSSIGMKDRPRVAILREEGINGASEMAFAFDAAGFTAVDVHMTDLISGRFSLSTVKVVAACGGFSYGDVLGAGRGWAQSVLNSSVARNEFEQFLKRPDSLMLGVCNGAQFMTHISEIIPGAQHWPVFTTNESRQFEARFPMVRIAAQPKSAWFHGMEGSTLPIVASHGEGRAQFRNPHDASKLLADGQVCLQYVSNRELQPTEVYPANPNGSPLGITGLTAAGGRVVAMMPHPERVVLGGVASYVPPGKMEKWGHLGPWHRMFTSARWWIDNVGRA